MSGFFAKVYPNSKMCSHWCGWLNENIYIFWILYGSDGSLRGSGLLPMALPQFGASGVLIDPPEGYVAQAECLLLGLGTMWWWGLVQAGWLVGLMSERDAGLL